MLKVIVLLSVVAAEVVLVQLPPYVIVPASFELKIYSGVVSLVAVGMGVTTLSDGAVVSIVKVLTERLSLTTPLVEVTLRVQSLYVLSARALKVIVVLLSPTVVLSLLVQLPP